jgi:hypothetical protein
MTHKVVNKAVLIGSITTSYRSVLAYTNDRVIEGAELT